MMKSILAIIAVLTAVVPLAASAQLDSSHVDRELASANHSLNEGHVKDAVEQIVKLLREIDPTTDKDAYWRTSASLIELLSQTENHSLASEVIHKVVATKIPESQIAYFQWMQFYLGRNLAYSGKSDEGEKVLRTLTSGDQRLVHIPAQRAAALMLSTIEIDKDNIGQSAIWMRRAVIGTLVDKRAASEEILDVLTSYANYLSRTRHLVEADALFRKLAPLYDNNFAHHGPKYLKFASEYLNNLTALGNFQGAENVLKILKDNVASLDVVANSVREELFFQDLYQLARSPPPTNGSNPLVDRLKQVVSQYPDFLKLPRNRIVFSYFALVAGDVDLSNEYNSAVEKSAPLDEQFAAYEIIIKSFIAAHHSKFDDSIALVREALDHVRIFHRRFENESSSRLPAISLEERTILSLILGADVGHVSTFDQANTLFQLGQYLSRDKGKMGLNARVALQALKSDLEREDIRSRDRLQSLRDKIMDQAADALLARVLPIRGFSPDQKNDFGPLLRLEEIEDRISTSDERMRTSLPEFSSGSADSPVDLGAIQRLLKPNEALVLHILAGGAGFITTCIESDRWTFNFKPLDVSVLGQFNIDFKLMLAAVHVTAAPSATLDVEFPVESSFNLYQIFFGGIEACLHNKTHILLATDPDFFTVPWNALLTKAPSNDRKFSYRDAAWLSKTYALSLLPSVQSLQQLRTNLSSSAAKENFLGVGAPDFKGAPEQSKQIALAPLFVARGVANRTEIESLPALPDTADELRTVARALGSSGSHILLGQDATERELRKHALNNYRVISFATHAVVAGEIEGVTEPALVLSPGLDPQNEKNDGLLTATEIANLALDANLVILSACNTAASDGRASGRGLSGLADAFFFAGTRSIAVTQWPVVSAAAKQLGAGLISNSLGSRSSGVAEGLRRTMVEYISSAKEDYLAHPRFWAAFIIAGDGAVRPLDSNTEADESRKPVKLEWEYLSSSAADDEFMGLANIAQTAFAVGIQKPPKGEKRAGSYFVQLTADKNVTVVSRDGEIAASSVVALGTKIGLLGYYPNDTKSSAVFRVLERDGRERWRYIEDSKLWNFPVSIIPIADGYILISVETDFSASRSPSGLILNHVSDSGAAIARRRITLPLNSVGSNPKNVAVDNDGNLIVAVNGAMPSSSPQRMWTNPRTGTKKYCVTSNSTVLLSIETKSLQLQSEKLQEGDTTVSIRQRDGRLYTAANFGINCSVEKNIKLSELGPKLELKSIFQTNSVNGINAGDLIITPDRFVLVGGIQTFLPTASTREIMSLEELKNYQVSDPWSDFFWEKNEAHSSAFVLVIRKDGTPLADQVFPDLRNRNISNIVEIEPNHFLGVGSAFGDRGWVIIFTLHETHLTFWDRLSSSLKSFFGPSGKSN
jgi:CHAT domain-containing protein